MRKTEKVGDERRRKGFLLLPKTIAGETRWLEWAEWVERLCPMYRTVEDPEWIEKRWVG
jgi:hypothetical protein